MNPPRDPRRDWDLFLVDVARIRAWERLLFIECGDGWIVEEAWRRALKGYACGLDTSPGHVAAAAELRGVPGKLEFQTWDGTRIPYPSRSFHRVFSRFALERCADPASVFGEMQRVLQPGGEVYLLELERETAAAAEGALATLAAALHSAGFPQTHELLRRTAGDGGAGVTAVIIRARCATTPVLPRVVEPVPAPPAA